MVLWWPRRLFRAGTSGSWRRTTLDLHHVVGFWASLLICVISLSGALIAFGSVANPLIAKLDERPPLNARSLSSSAQPGARRIPVDRALAVARAALPGAFASAVSIPAHPADFYQIFMKFPEDRSPSGRSRAYVDQFSGELLGVANTRTAPLGTRMLNLKRSWHNGDILARYKEAILLAAGACGAGVTCMLVWEAEAPGAAPS